MRGHVEESDLVKAERALRNKARSFAAQWLDENLSGSLVRLHEAEAQMHLAACAYAKAVNAEKRRK